MEPGICPISRHNWFDSPEESSYSDTQDTLYHPSHARLHFKNRVPLALFTHIKNYFLLLSDFSSCFLFQENTHERYQLIKWGMFCFKKTLNWKIVLDKNPDLSTKLTIF
jgi:hypothetical protein